MAVRTITLIRGPNLKGLTATLGSILLRTIKANEKNSTDT